MATDSSSTSGFQPAPGEGRRDGGGDGAGAGEVGLSGAGSVQDGGDERALREQRTPDWQALGDDGCWRDVDPSWNEPIFRALAGGAERLYLTYVWCNSCHKKIVEYHTIEIKDHTRVYQKHRHTFMVRPLRAVHLVTPTGTYVPLPAARVFDSPPFVLPFHHDAPCGLPEWL
jgi:hypothetical protein